MNDGGCEALLKWFRFHTHTGYGVQPSRRRSVCPDCSGRWEQRSLVASADVETGVSDYGASSSVGSPTVLNHAYEAQVGKVDCADYFVGTTEAATWPN